MSKKEPQLPLVEEQKRVSMRARITAQNRLLVTIDKELDEARSKGDTLLPALKMQRTRIAKMFGE